MPEHIEELPLLAASPQMETIPLASTSWQPSHEVPGGRGEKQAPLTLIKSAE